MSMPGSIAPMEPALSSAPDSMASDTALLRSFPETTSASLAAFAISRAVSRSIGGPLPPDTLDAARKALNTLSSSPKPPAVAGLVDAVEHGALAPGVDAFVLTAGSWRALLALADVVHDTQIAARILGAAALSSLAVLVPASVDADAAPAAKRMRIARFHATNGARFARAFLVSVPNPTESKPPLRCAAIVADLFGAVALRIARYSDAGAQSLTGPVAALLAGAFRFLPPEHWASALSLEIPSTAVSEETTQRRIIVALYLTRLARTEPPLVLSSALSDISVYLDVSLKGKERNDATAFLLELVSSSSLFVAASASRALLNVAIARGIVTAKRILQSVRDSHRLSAAIHSPHSFQRWKPLLEAMENEIRECDTPLKNIVSALDPSAKKFAELEAVNDSLKATAFITSN
eukprot:IDg19681t1